MNQKEQDLLQNIRQSKEHGSVDYLAPFIDEFNSCFGDSVRIGQSTRPCGDRTVALIYRSYDSPYRDKDFWELVFGGICSIEAPDGVNTDDTQLPTDFLKNIGYISGNVNLCGNGYKYEPSTYLKEINGNVRFIDFKFETITLVDGFVHGHGDLDFIGCNIDKIAPTVTTLGNIALNTSYLSGLANLQAPIGFINSMELYNSTLSQLNVRHVDKTLKVMRSTIQMLKYGEIPLVILSGSHLDSINDLEQHDGEYELDDHSEICGAIISPGVYTAWELMDEISMIL